MTYPKFTTDIVRMNATYELFRVEADAQLMDARLAQFKKILTDECSEIDDIGNQSKLDNLQILLLDKTNLPVDVLSQEFLKLVMLSDLLGDIIVFCASEAERFGIPLQDVMKIIMASNFSKLDANGLPIKDPETGKFLKGPNYWKPEPGIAKLLIEHAKQSPHEAGPEIKIDMDAVTAAAMHPEDHRKAIELAIFPEQSKNPQS
jgi:predicted HAD superfamily Cof-like phosphohydrolase